MLKIKDLARIAHEMNAAVCRAAGDFSQPSWEEAPDWQQKSAIDGVNFHLKNPDADAAASHENWLKIKVAEGWEYGVTKDPEKKTHPCMMPYHLLPVEQRIKDHVFKTTIHLLKDKEL